MTQIPTTWEGQLSIPAARVASAYIAGFRDFERARPWEIRWNSLWRRGCETFASIYVNGWYAAREACRERYDAELIWVEGRYCAGWIRRDELADFLDQEWSLEAEASECPGETDQVIPMATPSCDENLTRSEQCL